MILRVKDFWRWWNQKREGHYLHGNHREPTAHVPYTGRSYRIVTVGDHRLVVPRKRY